MDMSEEVAVSEEKSGFHTAQKKNFVAVIIIVSGLFVGSLLVDFVQLGLGRGFSHAALEQYNIVHTGGKTWVAYSEPKVTVQVVTDSNCSACDPSEALVWLRRVIPTLEPVSVESSSPLGKLLIERFSVATLPAFIFSGDITRTNFYDQASSLFSLESDRYFFDMGRIGLPIGKYLRLPKVRDNDIVSGPHDAPLTVIEFSDFQCPYCKTFHSDLMSVIKEYPGKVRFVYKQLPLSFHSQAENAALASLCANAQGKFASYADVLFQKQGEWGSRTGTQKFKDYARRVGLDGKKFATCLDTKAYQDTVDANKKEAEEFSLSGTPGTFVGGTFIPGAVDKETLRKVIEKELAN